MASIEHRNGKYRIMVSLGYGLDGKQNRKTTTYTPPEGVSVTKGEKLAKAFAHDFERHCRGLTNLNENMRLHELVDWYYTQIAPNLVKEITTYNQRLLMKLYVLDEIGHLKLKDISTPRLDELFNHLRQYGGHRAYYVMTDPSIIPYGARRAMAKEIGIQESVMYRVTSGGRVRLETAEKIAVALDRRRRDIFTLESEKSGLSASTVNRVRGALSAVFSTAFRKGMIERNPIARTTPSKMENEKKPFLDENQCKRLLAIFQEQEKEQLKVAITTLLYTGLRSGELLALRWEDIDLAAGTISIRHTLTLLRGEYSLSTPKTKSSQRTIRVPTEPLEMLRQHKRWQAEQQLRLGSAWRNCGQVFTNETGWYYNRTTLNQQFRRVLRKCDGLPDLHIHDLRHANASLLINAGVPSRVIADHLGHQSTQTTENVYAHVFAASRVKAVEAISLALGGGMATE